MLKHKKFGTVRLNQMEPTSSHDGDEFTLDDPESYDAAIWRSSEIVCGGLCETQEMMKTTDSFIHALVHQMYKHEPYSLAHHKAVSELKVNKKVSFQSFENFDGIAQDLGAKMTIFQKHKGPQIFNPTGVTEVSLVFKDGYFDSCLEFIPNEERVNIEPQSAVSLDYDSLDQELKTCFQVRDLLDMAPAERLRVTNMYERYLYMQANNVPIDKPYFMHKPEKARKRPEKPAQQSSEAPQRGIRGSSRNINLVNYEESSESDSDNRPVKKRALNYTGASASPSPALTERVNNRQEETGETDQAISDDTLPELRRGQRPSMAIRTFDQKIGYPAPLPTFGDKSQQELRLPKINRKMTSINGDCKAHIRNLTKTNGYLTKLEWDNYCKTLVEEYPTLACDNENQPWASFKLGLQKSFSAERKKDKQNKNKKIRENAMINENTLPVPLRR